MDGLSNLGSNVIAATDDSWVNLKLKNNFRPNNKES